MSAYHQPYAVTPQAVAITQQFYDWDYRLRGYDLYEYPIHPEPVLQPLYVAAPSAPLVDDGRHETWLSRLSGFITGRPVTTSQPVMDAPLPVDEAPDLYVPSGERLAFQLTLPLQYDATPAQMASLLQGLKGIRYPMSMEFVATADFIVMQLSCMAMDAPFIQAQVAAYFPGVLLNEASQVLATVWDQGDARAMTIVDFGLAEETGLSIAAFEKATAPDPYVSLFAAMETMGKHECAVFQVLFTPVQ